jgi:aminoglycoside 6'-N-acetyltransferase I
VHLVTAENAHLLDRVDPDVFDHEVRPDLLRQLLGNPMNHLAVAVVDGIVVGMASAISYVHPDKPLQLFINEVGVASGYRRRGIARRLMELLLDHGRRLGCTEAWVATEVGNTAARALYRATGGVEDEERAVVFTYELGSRS